MSPASDLVSVSRPARIFHPYGVGLFPILALFAHNIGQLSLLEFLAHAAAMVLLVAMLLRALQGVLGGRLRAAILLSTFLFLFFSYGHFLNFIIDFRFLIGRAEFGPNAVLYPLFGLVLVLSFLALRRLKDPGPLTRVLNLFGAALILISLWNIAAYYGSARPWSSGARGAAEVAAAGADRGGPRPDIYYIILDGYSRSDYLKEIYHYDNSAFLDHLREKGFFVAERSTSNYVWTMFSLASSLNMTYLDRLAGEVGVDSTDYKPLKKVFLDNEVMRRLRQKGYRIVIISSAGFDTPREIAADEQIFHRFFFSEFQNHLLNITPIPVLIRRFTQWGGFQYDVHRDALLHALAGLEKVVDSPSPKLVYAHIFLPHAPFVFGENGEPLTPEEEFSFRSHLDGEPYLAGHNRQLAYLNKRIAKAVDLILERSPEPPVILLQSDHGHRYHLWPTRFENTDQDLSDAMSILLAYYLPDGGSEKLYPGMTPVNTFRILFNHYFGANFPLLEDRNYYAPSIKPYHFVDVTDRIR